MNVNQMEFQQKIHNYSKSTLELISRSQTSIENLHKTYEIVMSSNTEEEAVQRMKAELTIE